VWASVENTFVPGPTRERECGLTGGKERRKVGGHGMGLALGRERWVKLGEVGREKKERREVGFQVGLGIGARMGLSGIEY